MLELVPLDELCIAIVDCEHKTAPVVPVGIPSVRTTNIKNGRIDFENANRVSEETYREWTQRMEPQPGDLILAREAPVGDVGIIPDGQRACLGQRTVLIRPDENLISSRYLLYLLLSPEMRHEMDVRASGSTVAHLNMSDIRALEIPPLPPLDEQRAIASMLGSLDDKIELNRKMNKTLEAMAAAIFKAWFVDFEPVRAKASRASGFPGMPAEVFTELPSEFENTELGPIPKGWGADAFASICERITSGGTPKTSEPSYWDGQLPWLSSGETRKHFIVKTEKCITQQGVDNSSTRHTRAGTTVIASAGQGKTRGQTSYLFLDTYINQSVLALVPDSSRVSDEFVYLALAPRYKELRRISDANSSRGSLTKGLIGELPVVTPSKPTLDASSRLIKPLFDLIHSNEREIVTLAETRDALLPKLLSGEVRVGDVA